MTEREMQVLTYTYQLRIISQKQLLTLCGEDVTFNYFQKVVNRLTKDGYIEKIKFERSLCFQITTKGVSCLKKQGTTWIGNETTTIDGDEYVKASQMCIQEKNFTHQLALNEFVIRFATQKFPVAWSYRDDKFCNKLFTGFHPDGLLLVEDTCYLVEMDMNTETSKQLRAKWERYRQFFAKGLADEWHQIKVLFIIEGANSVDKRRELVTQTLTDILSDLIDGKRLEVCIDSTSNLLSHVSDEIINRYLIKRPSDVKLVLQQCGYSVSEGEKIQTGEKVFQYYVRKKDINGGVQIGPGGPIEFLLDDCRNHPYSVIHRAERYQEALLEFQHNYNRPIRYVILENQEGESVNYLRNLVFQEPNMLFTTLTRLEQLDSSSDNTCYYKMDEHGALWHFNEDYTKLIKE